MKVRSVTVGIDIEWPLREGRLAEGSRLCGLVRQRLEDDGVEVQTSRLATQPFPEILAQAGPVEGVSLARAVDEFCRTALAEYCSLGPVIPGQHPNFAGFLSQVPAMLASTERVFASVAVATPGLGIQMAGIWEAAQAVLDISNGTPEGFGNLRFAALANCPPNIPFFPAGYHAGGVPKLSVAIEAADAAVEAFSEASNAEGACRLLAEKIQGFVSVVERVCRAIEHAGELEYAGIDLSLAPFPEPSRSIGTALERLTGAPLGSSGTLFAAALVTAALRTIRARRWGFSGLMLPVLEDSVLARRAGEGTYRIDSLLLYSAVCGTGLDTIPLPGEASREELASMLLDVATLSTVLGKPLTARLLVVPGKGAGGSTAFDFPYFANAAVLPVPRGAAAELFGTGETILLDPR